MRPPHAAPPRSFVLDDEEKPAQQTERCTWWIKRFAAGWRPNRRIRALPWRMSAEWYGVTLWEWRNVIQPMLAALGVKL